MGPHADHACLSPKCRTEAGATVYDLPVGATRCPMCGSRRLQRLFNAVNVGRGIAGHVDRLVEPEVTRQRDLFAAATQSPPPADLPPAEAMRLAKPFSTSGAAGLGMIPPHERAAARATNQQMFGLLNSRGPLPPTRAILGL